MEKSFIYEIEGIIVDLDNLYNLLRDNLVDLLKNEIIRNELDYIDSLMQYIKTLNYNDKDYLEKLLVLQRCFYYLQNNVNSCDILFNRIMFIIQMIYNNLNH